MNWQRLNALVDHFFSGYRRMNLKRPKRSEWIAFFAWRRAVRLRHRMIQAEARAVMGVMRGMWRRG